MGCTASTPAAGGPQANANGSKHSVKNGDFDTTEREREPFVVGRTQRVYKTKPKGKRADVGEEEEVVLVDGRLSERDVDKRQMKSPGNKDFKLSDDVTMKYAFVSQRGFYPENHGKPNQDAWCLTTQWGGLDHDAFFAVFDGHGPFGHDCANYAKKNLSNGVSKYVRSNRLKLNKAPQATVPPGAASRQSSISSRRSGAHARNASLEEEEKVPENGDVAAPNTSHAASKIGSARSAAPGATSKKGWDPKSWPMLSQAMLEECLRQGHLDCNKNMRSNELVKDKLSGTTAISAAFHNNLMTICNVGDSRAIVGRRVNVDVDPQRVPQVLEYLVPDSEDGANSSKSFFPTPQAHDSQEVSLESNREDKMSIASGSKLFTSTTENMIQEGFKVTTLKSTALSVDQTPYRTDELERVKKAGARVLSLDQLEGVEPIHENWRKLDLGEDIDVEGDPPRVWVQDGEYPGTAFTRSIGDAEADAIGVTADPEIQTVKLTPDDKLIILASDGIFEFLPNQDVIDICALYPNDPLQAANAVVKKAYDLWLTYELRTDDITIIVMMLDWHEEGKSKAGQGDNATNEPPPPMVPHNLLVEPKTGAIASLKTMEQKENQRAKELCAKPSSGYRASVTLKNMLQEELLAGVLEFTPCFANMTEDQGDLILKAMECVTLKAGEFLVKEGDISEHFYALEEGKLGVRVLKDSPGEGVDVDETKGGVLVHNMVRDDGIGPCPTLGEVALIQTIPSAYSIEAETDCTLWSLHRTAFQTVRSEMNLNYRRILYYKLSHMKELHALNPIHIWKLVKNMETIEFEDGDVLFNKDNDGNYFYAITEGTCVATDGPAATTTYSESDSIGNETLEVKRGSDALYQNTITATSAMMCMRLERTHVLKFADSVDPTKVRQRAQSIRQINPGNES